MAGRPKANIDWDRVDKLLQAQCSGVGIASLLGIDYDTLSRRCKEVHKTNFEDYMRRKKSEGLELIRAKQFELAMRGDRTMLIWLGKQYLGQKENQELTGDMSHKIEIIRRVITGNGVN